MKSIPCRSRKEYRLRCRAKECVHYWVQFANAHIITDESMPIPAVRFDLRGKTAGQSVNKRNHPRHLPTLVRINADLLVRYPREMIQQTIPHEVAHAVTRFTWGEHVAPHGVEWKHVMRTFGKQPKRCHSMEATPVRKTAGFYYRCGCRRKPHRLGIVRHRRAQSGTKYRCRRCREVLRYMGQSENA